MTNSTRLGELAHDIRYACRLFKRSPGFCTIAILTLGLGVGANTAIFSVINTVFLRALPYPEPQRLVQFHREIDGYLQGAAQDGPTYFFLRDHLHSYAGIASTMGGGGGNLVLPDQSVSLRAMSVTADYFRTLGVEPALGRAFARNEDVVGGPNVAILSHALWREYFQSNPAVLQQTVNIGGTPYQITGVMPADFVAKPEVDIWLPLRPGGHDGGTNRDVVARLLPGVTVAQAQSELDNVVPEMLRALNIQTKGHRRAMRIRPYLSDAGNNLRMPLLVLMGAVAMVLLMACANLANLLLARAAGRTREIAVRAALGASRARIVRQLLVESTILALAGGVAGLLLARWTMPALLRISPINVSFFGAVSLDRTVLLFALLISMVTGIVFGLAPAFQLARLDLNECFKEGGRATTSRRAGTLRQLLVVSEVALSMTLLVVALLLIRTFMNLVSVNPGFDPRRLLAAGMTLRGANYDTTQKVTTFYRLALERMRQSPSIASAAVILNPPMTRGMNIVVTTLDPKSDGQLRLTDWRYITSDYFTVMGTPLIAGRVFTDHDAAGARVVIVNQTFARKFLSDQNPIGLQINFGGGSRKPAKVDSIATIVGLAPDMKQESLGERPLPIVYTPLEQTDDGSLVLAHGWFSPTWLVRSRDDGPGAAMALQQAMHAADPQQPLVIVKTMESMIDRTLTQQRFQMLLIGSCALLALILAAAGLFGVISYAVAHRAHELGVRLALGATSGQLVGAVVGQGATLAIVGIVIGLLGAGAASRVLTSFMYGVSATDSTTYVAAAALLLGIAIASSAVPAWRITRLDPATTLRQE